MHKVQNSVYTEFTCVWNGVKIRLLTYDLLHFTIIHQVSVFKNKQKIQTHTSKIVK
jgi:hypothetical protein